MENLINRIRRVLHEPTVNLSFESISVCGPGSLRKHTEKLNSVSFEKFICNDQCSMSGEGLDISMSVLMISLS